MAPAQWTDGISQCSTDVVSNNQLTIKQFSGLFYLLAIFLGAAILWACGEHLVVCFARRHPRYARVIAHPFRKVSSHVIHTAESFRVKSESAHGAGHNASQQGSFKDSHNGLTDSRVSHREVALVSNALAE